MDEPGPHSLLAAAKEFIVAAQNSHTRLVTAESCTAGALSTLLSEIPGAGAVLEGGFVSYSKSFKAIVLGVSAEMLHDKSAVDGDVAISMAQGALSQVPQGDLAIAITGVCGPEEDEDANPVGLAYIAVAHRSGKVLEKQLRLNEHSQGQLRGAMMSEAIRAALDAISQHEGFVTNE